VACWTPPIATKGVKPSPDALSSFMRSITMDERLTLDNPSIPECPQICNKVGPFERYSHSQKVLNSQKILKAFSEPRSASKMNPQFPRPANDQLRAFRHQLDPATIDFRWTTRAVSVCPPGDLMACNSASISQEISAFRLSLWQNGRGIAPRLSGISRPELLASMWHSPVRLAPHPRVHGSRSS
jgi:hypothetical protein